MSTIQSFSVRITSISFGTATDSSSTIDGKNDAANIDQLHAIISLIEALKPRVVTLENTAGLVNIKKNQPFFYKIIYDISSAGSGYNLRWNIVNMADAGLSQERKRLLIIAAKYANTYNSV